MGSDRKGNTHFVTSEDWSRGRERGTTRRHQGDWRPRRSCKVEMVDEVVGPSEKGSGGLSF